MKNKNIFFIAFTSITLLAVLLYHMNVGTVVTSSSMAQSLPAEQAEPQSSSSPLFPTAQANFIADMAQQLIEHHAHDIHKIEVQVTLVDFRQFVIEQYPDSGARIFEAIIERAFPAYISNIQQAINKMMAYDQWMTENYLMLSELDDLSENELIWGQRYNLFGEDAKRIWGDELDSEAAKRKAIQELIAQLNQDAQHSLNEKLYLLTDTIQTEYGPIDSHPMVSKGLVARLFFGLDSVQTTLSDMDAQKRASIIQDVRSQLGFSEQDITQLKQRDEQSEQAWQNGYRYVEQRKQLVDRFEGAALEAQLVRLQQAFFNESAATIAAEEKSGFYRFERPRLYGSN